MKSTTNESYIERAGDQTSRFFLPGTFYTTPGPPEATRTVLMAFIQPVTGYL